MKGENEKGVEIDSANVDIVQNSGNGSIESINAGIIFPWRYVSDGRQL